MCEGSDYIFRSDPQKFSEQFQQLGDMREEQFGVWSNLKELGPKCYPNENSVQFNTFLE